MGRDANDVLRESGPDALKNAVDRADNIVSFGQDETQTTHFKTSCKQSRLGSSLPSFLFDAALKSSGHNWQRIYGAAQSPLWEHLQTPI